MLLAYSRFMYFLFNGKKIWIFKKWIKNDLKDCTIKYNRTTLKSNGI